MRTSSIAGRAVSIASVGLAVAVGLAASVPPVDERLALFTETFDTHWERLEQDYPYFELYGVDWDGERTEHRPLALAAANATEFAWEFARMLSALPDPHLSYMPPIDTVVAHWSVPELETCMVDRRPHVEAWPEGQAPVEPTGSVDDPRAYPEIVAVREHPPTGTSMILAAGPVGTRFGIRLRWADGAETDHELRRPDEPNLPPPSRHLGDKWLVSGQVGSIGYMRIRSFDPSAATLGPDGKMTTMLRAALAELIDTEALILDLQGNGGGMVAASDPFLGNLLRSSISYRWGNAGGKRRVIRPRTPRYRGEVVAIVDQGSASGGEWAARILRDAGRATVIGGRTAGAEAAVHESAGPDGSVVKFSAWPMAEPGARPFQDVGIELDHAIPLTIEQVREHGIDAARDRVRRARFAKALELLGAPASDLDALVELARTGDLEGE